MSPFTKLHFWSRRASWRAGALGKLLVRLAGLAIAMTLAVQIGLVITTVIAAVLTAIAALFVLGAFTAEWRTAGVRTAQQYRRITHRSLTGKDRH